MAEFTLNNDNTRLGFKVTWDIVTDESVIGGDVAALGWMDPQTGAQCQTMPEGMGLRAALGLLTPLGYSGSFLESVEQDSSDPKSTKSIRWIWNVYGVDKGGDTVLSETRTLHFTESMTPATRARLVALLTEC